MVAAVVIVLVIVIFVAETVFAHKVIEAECGISPHTWHIGPPATLSEFYPATRNAPLRRFTTPAKR